MNVLITGGAGFIGSHLVDRLVSEGNQVTIIDNLSSGKKELLNPKAKFVQFDLTGDKKVLAGHLEGIDFVWHIAANPDVRAGSENPDEMYKNNILATYNLLEAMRRANVKKIAFTSTSTVYGDTEVIPTPETCLFHPVSVYGATKVACEAIIESYSRSFGIKSWLFRLANVIGARSNHGIIPDFIAKLKQDPKKLEILGDGTQNKSYIYIEDCLDGMFRGISADGEINIFNIGNENKIEVKTIAGIISEELGVTPELNYTGGKRGWVGDVPIMLLSIEKLKKLGWRPKYKSEEAIRVTVRDILSQR